MRRVLESPVLRECETENRRIAGAEGSMSVELKGLRFWGSGSVPIDNGSLVYLCLNHPRTAHGEQDSGATSTELVRAAIALVILVSWDSS